MLAVVCDQNFLAELGTILARYARWLYHQLGDFVSVSPCLLFFTTHYLGEVSDRVDSWVKHTRELAEAERNNLVKVGNLLV